MKRWRSRLLAIVLLPVNAVIIVPGLILWFTGWSGAGPVLASPLAAIGLGLGLLLILLGLYLAGTTMSLFATRGEGTPAPWDPPRKLVVDGIYRHLRNPMIGGVLLILAGESLVLGSLPLFAWFLIFLAANLIWIPLVEEPGLERRFGECYLTYKTNVRRWIPRLRPWTGGAGG